MLGDFNVKENFWDKEEISPGKLMTTNEKIAFVNAGWEIGAHSLTHPDLTQLTDEEVTIELIQSRKNIEETLTTKVISFAYPYGNVDERIKKITRESGYQFAVSTDSGGLTIEEDHFEIFRVAIFPEDGWFQLYKKTSSWYRNYYKRKRGV